MYSNSLAYDSGAVTIIISDLKHRLMTLVGTASASRFLRVSKINISTESSFSRHGDVKLFFSRASL